MQLVLLMYNVYPYFSLKNLGKKVCIICSKVWYMQNQRTWTTVWGMTQGVCEGLGGRELRGKNKILVIA